MEQGRSLLVVAAADIMVDIIFFSVSNETCEKDDEPKQEAKPPIPTPNRPVTTDLTDHRPRT